MRNRDSLIVVLFTCACAVACGGSQGAPATAATAEPESGGSGVTAEECEVSGGTVVGDIGDGAVHRPDYRCANGAKPTGPIRARAGGPIAVEGSVCCPKAADGG